jgi:hypothetical protein
MSKKESVMHRPSATWLVGVWLAVALPVGAAPKPVPDFVLQPAATASPSPWQVTGKVTFKGPGPTRLPATGIAVFLTATDGQVVDRGQTDARGQYLLSAPSPGRYEVRVDQSATTRRRGQLVAPFKHVITL